jgi:hypothetical protein
MKKFTLRVNFRGMCTFALDQGRMWVFLVNALNRPDGVPAHGGFIRFPLDNLSKKSPGNGVWRMLGYDVRFSPLSGEGLNVVCFDTAQNICSNPGTPAPDCFGQVHSAQSACAARGFPEGANLDPRFVAENVAFPVADAKKISARFLLTKGRVGVSALAAFDGRLIESRFRPFAGPLNDSDHRQVGAVEVFWETEVIGDSVTIEAVRLRNQKPAFSLTLHPRGGRVEISVFNEESEIVLGMGEGAEFILGMPRERDRIFESIFDICIAPPPSAELPIPVAERLIPLPYSGFPIVDGSPPCEPNTLRLKSEI